MRLPIKFAGQSCFLGFLLSGKVYLALVMLAGEVLVVARPAAAIVRSWDGASGGNWITSNNWNPNGVPASGDDAAIGAMAVANDATVIFGLFPPYFDTVRSLELSNGADLDINDGQITVDGPINIGGGFSGNTLTELFVSPVAGMDVDAVVANAMTINLNGRLTMSGGGVLIETGSPLSPGTLRTNSNGEAFGYGQINLPDSGMSPLEPVLINDGTIRVGSPNTFVIGEPPSRTLTIAAGAVISLGGDDHDGEVIVTRNCTLELDTTDIEFRGDMTLFANATLQLGFDFNMETFNGDTATLRIDSGATGEGFPLPAVPAVISGAEFTLGENATLSLVSSDDEVRIEADFTSAGGNFSNAGEIHFAGTAAFTNTTTFNTSGSGRIFNDSTGLMGLGIGIDFTSPLTNEGRLLIGGPTVEGEVQIESFVQTTTGTLDVKLSDVIPGDFDHYTIEGNALLDGTLNVMLLNDFEPILGNSFEILTTTFGNVSGEFSDILVPVFNNLTLEVIYNSDSVVLQVVEFLAGDFDGDGDVDGYDFLAWQRGESANPFSAGDLAAWQTGYGAGPLTATSVAVPEPTCLALVLSIIGMFTVCRRCG